MASLSIIIPAYNLAHFILCALESVRIQQLGNFELLLGDDASTDGTWDVVRREFPGANSAPGLAVNSGGIRISECSAPGRHLGVPSVSGFG